MPNNVFVFPTFCQAITLDDQGTYYMTNPKTGSVMSVIQLTYEDEWYLYQLQNSGEGDEVHLAILADNNDYVLSSMSTEEIRRHFAKPEYAEPRGAWQVIKNSKYGFGKFTPLNFNEPISYALILFTDNKMSMPVRLHKADEEALQQAEVVLQQVDAQAFQAKAGFAYN